MTGSPEKSIHKTNSYSIHLQQGTCCDCHPPPRISIPLVDAFRRAEDCGDFNIDSFRQHLGRHVSESTFAVEVFRFSGLIESEWNGTQIKYRVTPEGQHCLIGDDATIMGHA